MALGTFKFVPTVRQIPFGSGDQYTQTYFGTITFSAAGDTYATGGILALAGFAALNLGAFSDRTPLIAQVQSNAGSGWVYVYNISTKKLQIFSGAASGAATTAAVELTNGTAFNAGTPNIFTDVINFQIVFPRTY